MALPSCRWSDVMGPPDEGSYEFLAIGRLFTIWAASATIVDNSPYEHVFPSKVCVRHFLTSPMIFSACPLKCCAPVGTACQSTPAPSANW
jgi:hypothetical protein